MTDTVTQALALLGALTGPLGLLIAFLTYWRDRTAVRVTLRRRVVVKNGPANDAIVRRLLSQHKAQRTDPPMDLYICDPDKSWASLEIANIGRRKVIIDKFAWVPYGGSKFIIPGGYMGDSAWLPAELDEGAARSYLIDERQLEESGVVAVAAWDRTGRSYYGSFERSMRGLALWCQWRLRIKPYR